MEDSKEQIRVLISKALNLLKEQKNCEGDAISPEAVRLENPPKPELGDIGAPLFPFAKLFRLSPAVIAGEAVKLIPQTEVGEFSAQGPYINVRLNKKNVSADILNTILLQGESYGSVLNDGRQVFAGRRVMVEYSSPNTNKPLHLGHMRNDALGESISRILKKAGAEVYRVNIINNRGIHICKSMLAYKLFHEQAGDTPKSLGIKGDHFVGQCYVEFDRYLKGENGENAHPEAQAQAEEMLVKWEAGDEEIRALWKKMNDWTLSGIQETYKRTGVGFEKLYFESDTYLKGKEEILRGLETGVFFKADDGSVRIDVTNVVGKDKKGDDNKKVLLRKDGTSVYITQDIGTAISRHNDWAFNQMVYVVASEQNYHFKILFYILQKLGYTWADKLYHLSYGLVNLPSGRMKSREGTVVDADDLLDSLHAAALKAIQEKGRDEILDSPDEVAEKVALAAMHYYLLQVSPVKDMLFNPEESLSFTGNTGPYLQYMGARISSIISKAKEKGIEVSSLPEEFALLTHESEWLLIKALSRYSEVVAKAAEDLDPSVMAAYLYDLCRAFSAFYRDCPILSLTEENVSLAKARLCLANCTLIVLKDAMNLVLVPFLEKM